MGLDTGANRSENVAALASRAAASEDEISVLNPTEATAIKMAPKIRDRIPSSLMGLTNENSRTPLFQEGFAISGKEFRSRQSVGRWAGAAVLRSRFFKPMSATKPEKPRGGAASNQFLGQSMRCLLRMGLPSGGALRLSVSPLALHQSKSSSRAPGYVPRRSRASGLLRRTTELRWTTPNWPELPILTFAAFWLRRV
jgi:hypothetical protein